MVPTEEEQPILVVQRQVRPRVGLEDLEPSLERVELLGVEDQLGEAFVQLSLQVVADDDLGRVPPVACLVPRVMDRLRFYDLEALRPDLAEQLLLPSDPEAVLFGIVKLELI